MTVIVSHLLEHPKPALIAGVVQERDGSPSSFRSFGLQQLSCFYRVDRHYPMLAAPPKLVTEVR
jgi:hypothetical protein